MDKGNLMQVVDTSAWTELQDRSVSRIWGLVGAGERSIVACAPTGFGKTRIAKQLILGAVARGWPWIFYTHRKLLLKQTHESMVADGISHGVRASGWRDCWMPNASGQLSMMQSESAAIESGKWERYPAKIVFVDEAHANKAGQAEQIIRNHLSDGAVVVGITATPVGMGHLYSHLEILAKNSEARKVGALLPAVVFAPSEVDVSDVKRVSVDGEFNQTALAKKFQNQQVVGSVYESWRKHNPQGLPAIGFAPGVKESMWFCDEFLARGVNCAHIDGEKVYLGERTSEGDPIVYRGSEGEKMRLMVLDGSRTGLYSIVWNRFVLREGFDAPWLYHGIFATSFCTVEGWLQSVGRILRNHESMDHVLITDHGGNVWRPGLGSPNADREWKLSDTNSSIRKEAQDRTENPRENCLEDKQPKGCPRCHNVISFGFWDANGQKCPQCGFKFTHSVRCVFQTNGELIEMRGNAVKTRGKVTADAQKEWDKVYFPSSKSKNAVSSTFNQVRGRFEKGSDFKVQVAMVGGEKKVVAVHRQTGEKTVLRNVPLPGSVSWDRQVRHVNRGELQGGSNGRS